MIIVCIILINQSSVFATPGVFVGDINQSSVIDDEDIKIMQEYLIKLKNVTSHEQADMNNDGKLSIIDVSLLIKQQKECPYDKNNVTNISSWSSVPMVSKELLQKTGVTTGGEGCQWPIGMAISKDGKLLLYGTDVGGVYRSEDGGKNWEQSNAGLESRGVGAFAIDQKNSSHVLAVGINSGAFDTNGLYISEDGGKTWKGSAFSNELSFMPYNNRASIPMWSTTDENKVWIFAQGDYMSSSIDSGKTFKWDSNGITGILSGGNVHYNVYNPNIIYFGSQDYDGCVTTDGGKTWKYISMSGLSWGGYCYGGYAVDENTYFVGVSTAWTDPRKLKITFDGGKTVIDTGMCFTSQNIRSGMESSYQSPTDPKVLFACDLRSSDGGHTWAKMNGCINVYTHNPKGKKELYGIDEKGKNIVVSYDNGVTWQKVNNTEIKPQSQIGSIYILDLSYDWKNEMVYAACDGGYLYRISTKDGSIECILDKNVAEYKRAPVNLKGGYSITKVAVDPIDPNIIYCGGPGNTFLNDCALYRSVDGGKSFQVITSNTKNSIIKQGKQGGFETNSLEVNPKTGELLFAGGCFGISKLSPPYKLNN